MNAAELYARLEADFRLSSMRDDWREMDMNEYITENFRSRCIGLVTDNTDRIDYAYTAVFPSKSVTDFIIAGGRRNALLFVHHPMAWDINSRPVFSDVSRDTLRLFGGREISIYNLHVPLDAVGPYGTGVRLAEALGVRAVGEFYEYHGVNVGVVGETDCLSVFELKRRFEAAVGHTVSLYPYGEDAINGGRVALVAGGGNDASVYPYLREIGITAYITGVANMRTGYPPSVEAHRAAERYGVSILAGTHYSTEKFACMAMTGYFAGLGIHGEFVPDSPCMEDL